MPTPKFSTQISDDLKTATRWLKQGDIVGIPTETVYGLAGNALDEKAVLKIFEAKNRPYFDPLIVHVCGVEEMEKYVWSVPPAARELARVFMPGALTLLLPKRKLISDLVTSGSDRVAIRVPNHLLTLHLLQQLNFPVAAPSANPFGYISPTSAQHVFDQLSGKIPFILDGGNSTVGVESTIVGFEDGEPIVYRLGGISVEQIESIIGKVTLKIHASSNPKAPGTLDTHYAPRIPLYFGLVEENIKKHSGKRLGIISLQTQYATVDLRNQYQLSKEGDLAEAAKNLFAAMRSLDQSEVEVILAETFPEVGLGRAINDRLKRAAVKS